MYSKYSILLKSRHSKLAQFRRTRSDKGKKRLGRLFNVGRKRNRSSISGSITQGLLSGGMPVLGEIAVGTGATLLVSRLGRKPGSANPHAAIPLVTSDDKLKAGLQYLKEGSSLGAPAATGTIRDRLSSIRQRVKRGVNTYQDLSRLTPSRKTKVLAGLGISRQVGGDIWKELNAPLTRKR